MKRFVLSVFVMMSMTMAFAENEDNNATNSTSAYVMEVNMKKLGEALNLSRDQYDFVEDAMNAFCADLMSVGSSSEDVRKAMLRNAVLKNISATHSILTEAQYHKYLRLLNATLNNRGLNK